MISRRVLLRSAGLALVAVGLPRRAAGVGGTIYIAPYIGSGTRSDPWRPRGSDQPGWSAIRLLAKRQAPVDAHCLLWLPAPVTDPQLEKIGEDFAEALSQATKGAVIAKLGARVPAATRLNDFIAELLLDPPENGWNPLLPSRRTNRYEVVLGGQTIWTAAAIRGGASETEDFSATLDTGKWEIGGGDWGAIARNAGNNRGRATGLGADSAIRLITPAIDGDQYGQAAVYLNAGNVAVGPAVRMQAGTNESAYRATAEDFVGGEVFITEVNSAFAITTLATDSATWGLGDIVRGEAEGSTIRAKQNGNQLLSVTDTTLTTGQPGLTMYCENALADVEADDWEGGDIGGAAPYRGLLGVGQ